MSRQVFVRSLRVAFAVSLLSCTETTAPDVAVATVSVTVPRTAFRVGETIQAAALPLDASGGVLTGRAVKWSSSDASVATVSEAGLITGVGPGTATITAEVEGKTGTAVLQLSLSPVASITINPPSQTVSAGLTVPFTVVLKDSADRVITGRQVSWTVANPSIATVTSSGVVTGVLVGTTQVVATAEGKQSTAALTVNTSSTPVATVTVSPSSASMSGGGTKQLTAVLRDINGNLIEGRAITWTSSNPNLATVSSTGLVTAAAGDGSVVITATVEGKSATASFDILTFIRMSAGNDFTCGVIADGTAYCWGLNNQGQLGDGTTVNRLVPTRVSTNVRFLTISSGNASTCGIAQDGFTYCWGYNDVGTLGIGSTVQMTTAPAQIFGGYKFVSVAVGWTSTCATTADADVYCWGFVILDFPDNPNGNGPFAQVRREPSKIGGGMVAVVAGLDNQFCSVDSTGIAYCWTVKFSTAYPSGVVTPPIRDPISTTLHFSTVRVGYGHACGLVASGEAYCWGRNDLGQLGDGTTTTSNSPVPVSGSLTFTSLAAGGSFVTANGIPGVTGGFSCGLTQAGKAYCWGSNVAGQLGIGPQSDAVMTPQAVVGFSFTGLRAGAGHACGLVLGGPAYCWGSNQFGAIGNGTTTLANQPSPVFEH